MKVVAKSVSSLDHKLFGILGVECQSSHSAMKLIRHICISRVDSEAYSDSCKLALLYGYRRNDSTVLFAVKMKIVEPFDSKALIKIRAGIKHGVCDRHSRKRTKF